MISAYLIDELTVRYLIGRDQWNTSAYEDVEVKGRIGSSNRLIRNATGEQVAAAGPVFLSGDIKAPTTADKIVIAGVEHAIIRVDKKADFSMSHFEAWIQ